MSALDVKKSTDILELYVPRQHDMNTVDNTYS